MAPLPPEEHLAKVPRFLHGAVGAFRDEAWETAIHALYYASLHAALGLLAGRGVSPGTRAGAVNVLGLHFVKPGLMAAEAGRALPQLATLRHLADYGASIGTDRGAALEAGRLGLTALDAVLAALPGGTEAVRASVGRLRDAMGAAGRG